MTYVPNGTVKLCSVPAIDTHNSLYFDSEAEKENYFNSKVVKTYSKVSYIRRSRAIKLDITYNELLQCNYIMFQNQPLSSQWIYAKIVNYEMINYNCYSIKFAIDTWMTWQNKLTFKESYVKRHTIKKSEDVAGKNILAENFNFSNYVWESETYTSMIGINPDNQVYNYYLVMEVLGYPKNSDTWVTATTHINNVVVNTAFYIFSLDTAGDSKFAEIVSKFNTAGKMSEIVSIFYFPKKVFENSTLTPADINSDIPAGLVDGPGNNLFNFNAYLSMPSFEKINKFNISDTGKDPAYWTPKNNKLFTFPYLRIVVTNNIGTTVYLKPEQMVEIDGKYKFHAGVNLPSPHNIYIYPTYYNGGEYANVVSYNSFPETTVTTSNSAYYLAMNRNSIGFQQDSARLATAENQTRSLLSGVDTSQKMFEGIENTFRNTIGVKSDETNLASLGNSVVDTVTGFMKADYPERQLQATLADVELRPSNSQGNRTSTPELLTDSKVDICCYYERYPISIMRLIDDYFSKYGYNISQFKPITFHNRTQWEYYETSNISIEGDVPENELDIIKGLFNNGFRVWYKPANFLNYSLANN